MNAGGASNVSPLEGGAGTAPADGIFCTVTAGVFRYATVRSISAMVRMTVASSTPGTSRNLSAPA